MSISVVNMEVNERSSCVRGYHIYKDIWDTVIGEEIQCEREPDTNRSNQYAVTIKMGYSQVICHINITSLFPFPRKRKWSNMSYVCYHICSTDSRQRIIMVQKFLSFEVLQQWQLWYAFRKACKIRLSAIILLELSKHVYHCAT